MGEKEIIAYILPEKPTDEKSKTDNHELKAAKSDDNSNRSNKAIQLNDLQNVVLITTNRFCFYIIIVFLIGMITGMILNAPQDLNQINLD